jgi:hypothetical protein
MHQESEGIDGKAVAFLMDEENKKTRSIEKWEKCKNIRH